MFAARLWRGSRGCGMLLAATLACASAGAAPVGSGAAGFAASMEPRDLLGAFFHAVAPGTISADQATTLHDLLSTEESVGMPLELGSVPSARARQTMIHGLLADLDTGLRALLESGYDEPFTASRETGPGPMLRVAQQSRSRAGLY